MATKAPRRRSATRRQWGARWPSGRVTAVALVGVDTFEGGCATYGFQFVQRAQALVNEVSAMLSFVGRADVEASVRATRGDDVRLDPPEDARTLAPSGTIGARS